VLIDIEIFESPVPDFCCCDCLARALADEASPIVYLPHVREFGIRIYGSSAKDSTACCPFCGRRFPPGLRELWFDELDRLELEPEEVPDGSDLRSDRWWRAPRAGLSIAGG
jgi:uncharacterized protein DUF6980